jgi:hypothetical protein
MGGAEGCMVKFTVDLHANHNICEVDIRERECYSRRTSCVVGTLIVIGWRQKNKNTTAKTRKP